jgi:hypothetical protein
MRKDSMRKGGEKKVKGIRQKSKAMGNGNKFNFEKVRGKDEKGTCRDF